MSVTRRNWLTLTLGLTLAMAGGSAMAATRTINVDLWDKGAQTMNMLGHQPMMGMAMGKGHMGNSGFGQHKGPMGIAVSTHTVAAGDITFAVTNSSKTMVHEMVVAPVKDAKVALPYDAKEMKVDEDAAGHLGEVAELEPGKKGALTLNMKPGQYILYCNIPGHYELGMWTLLTVK